MASKKSQVWEYFDFRTDEEIVDKSTTVCNICKTEFKYATGSTSSMCSHLKRKHGIVVSKVQVGEIGRREKKSSIGQMKLQDAFSLKNKISRTSKRHADITRSVGLFIAKDMRPFSVLENEGFLEMVHVLEPKYEMPCRTHFSEKVIPELYKETREMVMKKLKSAEFIALTTDSWTSRATESYNTVTAHFLEDWTITSYVLQTRVMHESHTAENLGGLLQGVVDEWDLKRMGQMPSLTTDNARNILNAGKEAGFKTHIGCVAHTINLATQRGLKVDQFERLLGRIRRVVTYFHKSSTATAILKTKQALLEIPQHKLIIDVSTRWNSTYDMLERFLEQQPAVHATLMMKDLKKNIKDVYTLSDDDISSTEKVISVLKPIKSVTTILCGELSPTVSMIHPLKEMLLQQLKKVNADDNRMVSDVKKAISKDLESRYTDPDMVAFLHESSCLDPRFKAMPYLEDGEKDSIFESISCKAEVLNKRSEAAMKVKKEKDDDDGCGDSRESSYPPLPSLNSKDAEAAPDAPSPSCRASVEIALPPLKKKKCALDDLFGDIFVTKVELAGSLKTRIEHEVINYKSEANMPLASDPLLWWKSHENTYPLLAKLAKKYLCVPATSVASERVFSTAGDLVTAQRSCLSSENVDRLIFLKKNL